MSDFFEYVAELDARQCNDRSMHRKNDHQTSIDASERVAKKLSHLQTEVLEAFLNHGPMTDGEMEKLPQFAEWKPSTARKRRNELYANGYIAATEDRRDRMTVWRAVTA